MENLRPINDINYTPIKGDNVLLDNRIGILLDADFQEIHWQNNDEIQLWVGGYESFIEMGGQILIV